MITQYHTIIHKAEKLCEQLPSTIADPGPASAAPSLSKSGGKKIQKSIRKAASGIWTSMGSKLKRGTSVSSKSASAFGEPRAANSEPTDHGYTFVKLCTSEIERRGLNEEGGCGLLFNARLMYVKESTACLVLRRRLRCCTIPPSSRARMWLSKTTPYEPFPARSRPTSAR